MGFPCRGVLVAAMIATLASAAPIRAESETSMPESAGPPAGQYHLDPAHARLIFSVNHLGFSDYTAFFTKFEAELAFDPAAPETMTLEAKVDAGSVETLYSDPALDFNAVIAGETFLDAATFPEMTFTSTRVRVTGPGQAAVTGALTLHGITKPVTLRVRYNGGYAGHPLDPGGARIGFSAEGALFRSDFGIAFGIPAPGTTMGVFDLVAIRIEAEFINPDAPGVQVGP